MAGLGDEAGEPVETLQWSAAEGAGERVDRFLARCMPEVSRARIQQWMALGAVWSDDRELSPKTRLSGHERLYVQPLPRDADRSFEPDDVPLTIVDEDESLLVIDKPAGLVTHPAAGHWRGTLLNGLLHHRPASARLPRAGIVHRLDKDTSGLMVVGKTEAACSALIAQLADRSMSRRYLAIVQGRPPSHGEIDLPIGRDPRHRTRMAVVPAGQGRTAQTLFERLVAVPPPGAMAARTPASPSASLVGCALRTGRTHQIRVHLAELGHPLFGDVLYGGKPGWIDRQALHACALSLRHPTDGQWRRWRSPLPADLVALIDRLSLGACETAPTRSTLGGAGPWTAQAVIDDWLGRPTTDQLPTDASPTTAPAGDRR